MKIFVINLARSPERRSSIEQQLSLLNLNYEIIDAIDGSQLSYSDIIKETRPLSYAVTCGEIGCALSHINIYRKMVRENIPIALVLEDDAVLDYRSTQVMHELEKICNQSPTVTLLTETSQYIGKPKYALNDQLSIYNVLEASCSHGYIINFQAAIKLAAFLYPVWMVADKWQILREYSVCNVEAVIPPIIRKSEHSELTTIQFYKNCSWLEGRKEYIWNEIKKGRPLKIKLKRLIWTSLGRVFIKIIKAQGS
ncbi:glycosyltransferase family 25 protein [Pantoea anthophila]|uniref:glycosyltransferase family 25 protein n=1 Tax=Pantoea anthophila TaxID=470931 RepID=UPI00301D371A